MEKGFITVNDIKHYVYCEAIVYITHVLGIAETTTNYMELGQEIEKEKSLAPVLSMFKVAEVIKRPYLVSPMLKLTGTPDFVLRTKTNELIPVEIKWSEPTKSGAGKRDHVVQIAAYAILLERTFNERKYSVKRGVIYYLRPKGRLLLINIDYELKKEVLKILDSIRGIINAKKIPKTSRKKCESCNYNRYCPWKKEETRK